MENESTKTAETEESFTRRAKSLLTKCEFDAYCNRFDEDTKPIVDYFCLLRTTVSKASWKQYRASLVFYYSKYKYFEGHSAAIANIDFTGCTEAKSTTPRTSAQKKKSVPDNHRDQIIDHILSLKRTKYAQMAADWLVVGVIFGLRPCEWAEAKFIVDEQRATLLKVKNAKRTNGRSNGDERTLKLVMEAFTEKEREAVVRFMNKRNELRAKGKEEFAKAQRGCQQIIRRACDKLFPNEKLHISLASCRHQFAADRKKAKVPNRDSSAALGHISESTQKTYGKSKNGRPGGMKVLANPDEVARVRACKESAYITKLKSDKANQSESLTKNEKATLTAESTKKRTPPVHYAWPSPS